MRVYILIPFVIILIACTDKGETGSETGEREHVWSEQVNTIDKAKGVEDILGGASDRQREGIDRQSQ